MSSRNEWDNTYWTEQSREHYDRDACHDFWSRFDAELERLNKEDARKDYEKNLRGAERLSDSWD